MISQQEAVAFRLGMSHRGPEGVSACYESPHSEAFRKRLLAASQAPSLA